MKYKNLLKDILVIYYSMNTNSEILLTPLQRAQKKYYEKIKSTDKYKEKRREISKKQYSILKDDPIFKEKVSKQKKEYYYANRKEILLEIIV